MNIKEETRLSRSESETEAFGAELAAKVPRRTVVLLRGNLGAGKTVFTRGFARGLGIDETVSSPTYTIVQEYPLAGGGRLYHLDLYRISGVEAALAFGVDEFLDDPKSIALLEWPERIEPLWPERRIEVELLHRSETEREIRVKCT